MTPWWGSRRLTGHALSPTSVPGHSYRSLVWGCWPESLPCPFQPTDPKPPEAGPRGGLHRAPPGHVTINGIWREGVGRALRSVQGTVTATAAWTDGWSCVLGPPRPPQGRRLAGRLPGLSTGSCSGAAARHRGRVQCTARPGRGGPRAGPPAQHPGESVAQDMPHSPAVSCDNPWTHVVTQVTCRLPGKPTGDSAPRAFYFTLSLGDV